jgi:hypothetical protein
MITTTTRCSECYRLFDLYNELDRDELAFGHDCEEPMPTEYWEYVFEIRALKAMPQDANVRDEVLTLENGPLTAEERLGVIEDIFDLEQWDWPDYLIGEEA